MWELQQHMYCYIAPSIFKASQSEDEPHKWLAMRYVDQLWEETQDYDSMLEEAMKLSSNALLDAIVLKAEKFSVTNGGHEVYLDDYTTVPWCTEEEMLAWHA